MDMEDKAHMYHSRHPAGRASLMERKLPQTSADEEGNRAVQQWRLSEHRHMYSARAPTASFVKQIDRAPDIGKLQ